MSLSTSVGASLDRIFQSLPELARFTKLKASGQDLRRFFHEKDQAQQEIFFYRDKWWTKDGGRLYVELSCLVPAVQMALCGISQSLAAPDYSVPFTHFQYGTTEADQQRCWQLHSPADISNFEDEMRTWLLSVALPWLTQFDSTEGVIRFMRDNKQHHKLAVFLSWLGDAAGARNSMISWLRERPRQIENNLQKLVASGLISVQDGAFLAKASIQSEDQYQLRLEDWIARAEQCAPPDARNDGAHR